VYLDQAEVRENLIDNGGMEGTYDDESGGGGGTVNVASGWSKYNVETDGTDTLDAETSIVHSGSKSQKAICDTTEGIFGFTTPLSIGSYYTLSVFLRGANGGESIWCFGTSFSRLLTLTTSWVKHSFTFKSTASHTYTSVALYTGTNQTFYIDDISLTKLDTRAATSASRTLDYLDGKVDSVIIWDRALTPEEAAWQQREPYAPFK